MPGTQRGAGADITADQSTIKDNRFDQYCKADRCDKQSRQIIILISRLRW
jgi:hypothetical protein